MGKLEELTGFAGEVLIGYLIGICIFIIIRIISMWKIFKKAGQAGWKSLIPIYGDYVLCKIIGISFWLYYLIFPAIIGAIAGIVSAETGKEYDNIVIAVYVMLVEIYSSFKLAKAYGKGFVFTLGLILLPGLFYPILGFGSSKYVGKKRK